MKKKIQSILLMVTLMFGLLAPATSANAETTFEKSLLQKSGFEGITVTEAIDDVEELLPTKRVDSAVPVENRAYWTQFASDYYYTYFLNDAEKNFWNALDELCLAMATTTQDYSVQPSGVYYLSEVQDRFVPCDASISQDRMIDLMFLFIYSNPQYYFLSNRVGYTYPGRNYGGILVMYDAFTEGDTRKGFTDNFAARINAWVADVNQVPRPEEKVKRAHDIVCQNTVYKYNDYDQSAYSMVLMGETVCAGYAKTMQILCNAIGVECLMVTGDNHAWNALELHGVWYQLDATWADQEWGIIYDFYNKSRTTFYAAGGHTEEEPYNTMLVDAPYDMYAGDDYVYPYFIIDNVTYFVVNDNLNLGQLLAKPIDATGEVPLTVTNNGKVYNVIGGSANAGASADEARAQVMAFVERMYTVALGRPSDVSGMETWTDLLMSYKNDGAGISRGFILSDEFKGKNYSNEQYLNILYATFFNRPADEGGYTVWMNLMNEGKSREFVLAGFVNSVEFDNLCTTFGISRGFLREDGSAINPGIRQFANRLYTKVLEREGDKQGIEDWTLRIGNGVLSPAVAAKSFFMSEEYLNKKTTDVKYVEALYRTFMGREADLAGKTSWVNNLRGGMSRETVLEGFANSDEFRQIMQEFGL